MKMLLALLIVVLIVASAYAQTEFMVSCQDGFCIMRESDLERLQQIINALVNRIEELKDKTGCS